MNMSSRSGCSQRLAGLEFAVVAEQCPDEVNEVAGERDQGSGVDFAFGSFAPKGIAFFTVTPPVKGDPSMRLLMAYHHSKWLVCFTVEAL